MTDQQGFREIQLSGKQLVFLFMASVVLAVGVFLLGVSVGRGVRQAAGPAVVAEATPVVNEPVAAVPPPTTLSAEDTQFDNKLQGKPAPPVVPEPPAPSTVAAPVTPPAAPASASVEAEAPPAAASAKPVPPAQGWMLQVGAFRSRANADSQVKQLSAKGYSAVVVPGGSLFRVRVGPYEQRAEADRAAARLTKEEGLSPSVTR